MRPIYHADFLDVLGWSLVDSLWQMGVLWLLYILLTANGKRFSASVRYFMALLTIAGGTVWFLAGILLHYHGAFAGPSHPFGSLQGYGFRAALPAYISPLISLAYLATLIMLGGRLLYHYRATKQLYSQGLLPSPDRLQHCLAELQHKLDLVGEVTLRLSEKVVTPLTTGFIKPILLLPLAAVNQLSMQQLEALIAHELFHIKRNDYLLNLGLSAAGQLFFFNPFARWLLEAARKEREASCDDAVLLLGYNTNDYARALYTIGKNQAVAGHLAMAATGKGGKALLQRIRRILHQPVEPVSLYRPLFCFVLVLCVVVSLRRESPLPLVPAAPNGTATARARTDHPATSLSPSSLYSTTEAIPKPSKSTGTYNAPSIQSMPAAITETPGSLAGISKEHPEKQNKKDEISGSPAPSNPAIETVAGGDLQNTDEGSHNAGEKPAAATELITSAPQSDGNVSLLPDGPSDATDETTGAPAYYVSGIPESAAFSLLEKKPVVPEPTPVGRTLPYVPASTFYYPEQAPGADSTERRSIRL